MRSTPWQISLSKARPQAIGWSRFPPLRARRASVGWVPALVWMAIISCSAFPCLSGSLDAAQTTGVGESTDPDPRVESPQEEPTTPPAVSDAPIDVRRLLDSTAENDWVRGLTLLAAAASVPDGAPQWTTSTLLEYIEQRGLENPERTRAIFAHPVMRQKVPGEAVLLKLLEGPGYETFAPEIEEAITRVAADRARRDDLSQMMISSFNSELVERLFPLLARHEPGALMGVVVDRLTQRPQDLVDPALLRAVSRFIGRTFDDTSELDSWWGDHQGDAILTLILEQDRFNANERAKKLWARANDYLVDDASPSSYRGWLIDSLEPSQPAGVRVSALQEIERFVPRITTGEGAQPLEQQRELLRPLLVRLQQIISREAVTLGDRDPLRTRIQALRSLRALSIFRDEETVVALLEAMIDDLDRVGFSGESASSKLSLLAVRVAGAMKAPVGGALDGALNALLPEEGANGWAEIPTEPLEMILSSLGQVGARSGTIENLSRLYRKRPDVREEILEVFVLRSVPEESTTQVLALFTEALAIDVGDSADGNVDENLRTLAINGIGRLGLIEGIEPLEKAIQSDKLKRDERTAALKSIQSIGGRAALKSIERLWPTVAEGDDLRTEMATTGAEICASDPSLELLEAFLLAEGDAPLPWFSAVIANPAIAELLDPGRLPADFCTARPRDCARFERLQAVRASLEAQKETSAEDLSSISEALLSQSEQIRSILEVLGESPQGGAEGARKVLDSIALSTGGRGQVTRLLSRREIEALWAPLEQLLEAEQALFGGEVDPGIPGAGGHILWLIDQVLAHPLEEESLFLDGLEAFLERYPRGDVVREKLAELEARVNAENGGGDEEPPPVDSGDGV